jgi:peptidyl-dipeptidase Dcp
MRHLSLALSLGICISVGAVQACTRPPAPKNLPTSPSATATATTMATSTITAAAQPPLVSNPLLEPWTGPYGGVPPFDRVAIEHFKPALEQAMSTSLAEYDRIARQTEAPTFANTVAAMERATRLFTRVQAVYGVWSGAQKTPAFQEIEREMEPKLAAFADKITQNEALFRRIDAIYDARERSSLTPEQQRQSQGAPLRGESAARQPLHAL